jgi:Type II restriction endonuclease EcoO109I
MIDQDKLATFIEAGIQEYHERILERLLKLKLSAVLKRKNPYLFKAKALDTSEALVKSILEAHLSSQEEAIFGGFLEQVAIYVCQEIYRGIKSSAEGIDLEFETGDVRYIVSIKSGPNWGNSSQIAKMKDHFKKAKRILGTNVKKQNVVAINGCCYGKDDTPDKGEYLKLCGQRFWGKISGDDLLYTKIIEPLGHQAYERNDGFRKEYAQVINKFMREFLIEYCHESGEINWGKLLEYNSGAKK